MCFLATSVRREIPTHIYFFFNDTATTEIYTLSLHDALPISAGRRGAGRRARTAPRAVPARGAPACAAGAAARGDRKSTRSELQSPCNLVCRLLLEKKK